MSVSINAEKAFGIVQHLFIIKKRLHKVGIEGKEHNKSHIQENYS